MSGGVAELVMDEEQGRTVDNGSAQSDRRDNFQTFPREGIETCELRELAARGIDKPETLSLAEIECVCIEVKARLARRDARGG